MMQPRPLYDSHALRELESRAAKACGGGDALMQRAGLAAWHELLAHWPQAQRIVVVCGPGNNGGDGYVLATHARQAGRAVRVLRLLDHAPRSALAQHAEGGYRDAQGRIETFTDAIGEDELIVDALFGIGLSRAPDGPAAALIEAINAAGVPVLALDVPSGVDADSGAVPGAAVVATRTLQLMAAHVGLATGAALEHVGVCALASLDVPETLSRDLPIAAGALHPDALAHYLRPRPRNSHKGKSGRVLCIGGDHGKGGAMLLCAQAALRSGAGLLEVATRQAHVGALLARCPEAMSQVVESADDMQAGLHAADVLAVGPGLGTQTWGRDLFDTALASGKSLVVDADALNLLAQRLRALPAHTILTPHPGEAARLLGSSAQQVQANRYAAVRALVERYRCVVVLKGAGTMVAAPDATPRVIAAGNPGMAVGGMGDVLTGVIAALRAQGLDAFDAASIGALLHGAAGDAAAHDDGERGLLPSDLFAHLRRLANPCAPCP